MLFAWQITSFNPNSKSNKGSRLAKVFKVKKDALTGEHSLEVKETYDYQDYINSFSENADPVTLMEKVKHGEIAPWNGENTLDLSQLPENLREITEYMDYHVTRNTEEFMKKLERAKLDKERSDMLAAQKNMKKPEPEVKEDKIDE